MTKMMKTADEVLQRLEQDGIEHLWVSYRDYHGRAGSKTVPKESFRSALNEGVVFALANFNFDLLDHQAPGATLLADSGDILAVPDPRSYVVLEQFPNTARMNAWVRSSDGTPWEGCPRSRLDAVVDELRSEGFAAQASFEPEFYILEMDADGDFDATNSAGMFTQDGLAWENELVQEIISHLHAMQIPVAQFGKEYGPGQYELTTRHGSPIQAVDYYYATREAVRYAARDFGYTATFMPKLAASLPGCSLHVHVSLWDVNEETNRTASTDDDVSLSDEGNWFMGGLLRHVEALTALGSPTVNSYKRLQPGTWAPANTYWGFGNRSGVIRVPGNGSRRRIEFRSGDNTCQPELFLAGILAAGLDGIRNKIDPGQPFQGDIGHMTSDEVEKHGIGVLPRSVGEGLDALERDQVIVDAVGAEAIQHFLLVKRSELQAYDLEVHPWERSTYLQGY